MNILSNRLDVEYDHGRSAVLIRHPDRHQFPSPFVEIRRETLNEMSLKTAAEFIGERLILLNPALREIFKDYLWTEDGQPPKRS
jgi:hypothetical protein